MKIALSDEPDFPHQGVVDFTDNRVDLNTGTLRFRAQIDNHADQYGNRFIVPGLFVRVRLPIGDPHEALMVPEQSLVSDQGRKTVYVIVPKKDKDDNPEKDEKGGPKYVAMVRDVGEVGVLRDGYREVEKGIELGDWIVRSGMQRIRPGAEVLVEKYDPGAAEKKTKEESGGTAAEEKHESPSAEKKECPADDLPARETPPSPADKGGGARDEATD